MISQDGILNKGNPAPVVDADGVIHNFIRSTDGALYDNAGGNWHYLEEGLRSDLT